MKKTKFFSWLTVVIAIMMISTGMMIQDTDGKIIDYDIADMTASVLYAKNDVVEEKITTEDVSVNIDMDIAPVSYERVEKAFSEMTLEEANSALIDGTLALEYSSVYSYNGLTKSKGVVFYNGHRETYYSEKVLPGNGLNIPGRHVADDGTIRDADGYICVAADPGFMAKGSILVTSLGPAKVYDSGCAYGTIDIYVSW